MKDSSCLALPSFVAEQSILGIANTYDCAGMRVRSEAFIHRHFEAVCLSDEFLFLPIDQLLPLLTCDAISLKSEETTFKGTKHRATSIDWVKCSSLTALGLRIRISRAFVLLRVNVAAALRWVMHDPEARSVHVLALLKTVRLQVTICFPSPPFPHPFPDNDGRVSVSASP